MSSATDERSSISEKRAPSSAITTIRQKSEPPFESPARRAASRARRPSARARAGRAPTSTRFSTRELVVVGDQLRLVVARQQLEADALRAPRRSRSRSRSRSRGRRRRGRASGRSQRPPTPLAGVGVEAAQVGEAPVLVRGGRQRQLGEPLRGLVARDRLLMTARVDRAVRSGGAGRAGCRRDRRRTPCGRRRCRGCRRLNSTPFASSSLRASATSGTRSAKPASCGPRNAPPIDSRLSR